jgi:hypothetical protein
MEITEIILAGNLKILAGNLKILAGNLNILEGNLNILSAVKSLSRVFYFFCYRVQIFKSIGPLA